MLGVVHFGLDLCLLSLYGCLCSLHPCIAFGHIGKAGLGGGAEGAQGQFPLKSIVSPNMFVTLQGENYTAKLYLFLAIYSLYQTENSGKFESKFQ